MGRESVSSTRHPLPVTVKRPNSLDSSDGRTADIKRDKTVSRPQVRALLRGQQQRELHNNIKETFDILRRYSNMSVRVIQLKTESAEWRT